MAEKLIVKKLKSITAKPGELFVRFDVTNDDDKFFDGFFAYAIGVSQITYGDVLRVKAMLDSGVDVSHVSFRLSTREDGVVGMVLNFGVANRD